MTTNTNTSFETHFSQFLVNRKHGVQLRLQDGSLTIDEELANMKVATSTLINDYGTIYSGSDPIDSHTLTATAVALMRPYFADLAGNVKA